jgi:hypothetical protein
MHPRSPKLAAQSDRQEDRSDRAYRQEDEEQAEAALVADVAEAADKEVVAAGAELQAEVPDQYSKGTPTA